jgi:hypothetical protein
MNRDTPLFVMIFYIQLIGAAPRAPDFIIAHIFEIITAI